MSNLRGRECLTAPKRGQNRQICKGVEARAGIEPACKDLQSSA